MGCTGAGLVAIIVLFIAVVLNAVSIILPAWSTNKGVTDTGKADFAAGVWGYCTDVDISAAGDSNASITFDHCYFFHTTNDYELPELNDAIMANFSKYSVCDGYDIASKESDAAALLYSQGLAMLAGLDEKQFDRFVDRSCGPLGSATLVFASLSIVAGVFSFIALLLGVTCCKTKSAFVTFGKFLAIAAFITTLLTFLMWLGQVHPLSKKDDVGYGGAFILSVLAAVLYLIVVTLVARHSKMR
uniref:Uncharacterized protein n=1 Tax=Globisporangium ultimum (strain ATCC 200006 / CBS 805.95 / DAOM BR144) TaxID=431595 RepID=K3XBT5_GLOUD